MTTTKRDLVLCISEETGIPQEDVYAVIEKFLGQIRRGLIAGHRFEFRDFGVFEVAVRKSRIGRNPKRPQDTVTIPERRVAKFRAGKELRIGLASVPAPAAQP